MNESYEYKFAGLLKMSLASSGFQLPLPRSLQEFLSFLVQLAPSKAQADLLHSTGPIYIQIEREL